MSRNRVMGILPPRGMLAEGVSHNPEGLSFTSRHCVARVHAGACADKCRLGLSTLKIPKATDSPHRAVARVDA